MILHVSAQRFCCRNRVARVVAHWGAKSAREKYKGSDTISIFKQHRDDQNFSVAFGIKIDVFLIGLRTPALSLTC